MVALLVEELDVPVVEVILLQVDGIAWLGGILLLAEFPWFTLGLLGIV